MIPYLDLHASHKMYHFKRYLVNAWTMHLWTCRKNQSKKRMRTQVGHESKQNPTLLPRSSVTLSQNHPIGVSWCHTLKGWYWILGRKLLATTLRNYQEGKHYLPTCPDVWPATARQTRPMKSSIDNSTSTRDLYIKVSLSFSPFMWAFQNQTFRLNQNNF